MVEPADPSHPDWLALQYQMDMGRDEIQHLIIRAESSTRALEQAALWFSHKTNSASDISPLCRDFFALSHRHVLCTEIKADNVHAVTLRATDT